LEPARYEEKLVRWLKEKVAETRRQGLIFGLSGGVDSSVVAALATRACPDGCLGLIMPCESDPRDREDALLLARHLRLPVQEVDLSSVYRAFLAALEGGGQGEGGLPAANLKPRLRMAALYYYGARRRYLVVGTSNLSELVTGYFTKFGDAGADIMPLAPLTKGEVFRLAEYLEIPGAILAKPPSGGLWAGQTDEGEMGVTYRAIDAFLRGGELGEADRRRIEALELQSRHKRALPTVPDLT
jgi:NAD+ synthase